MPYRSLADHLCIAAMLCIVFFSPVHAENLISLPPSGLSAKDVAILVNENDPLSQKTGAYYQKARKIPQGNVIRLRFPVGKNALSVSEFEQLQLEINRKTPSHIQAFAVAWTQPFQAGCMSITSALALGHDPKYCSTNCGRTAASGYFNSPSRNPLADHKLRPAMMLAGKDFEQIKALVDRGLAADYSHPDGTAYLLKTSDKARSSRAPYFMTSIRALNNLLPIKVLNADFIENRADVLFYFTGMTHVSHLESLTFQPGALADHLTSSGGQLFNIYQMSSLRWLEAGATASYGTVTEPCNYRQKFPYPAVAMFHYLMGATALEAYWKSVEWPGEGVFIGEPLARPFAPQIKRDATGEYELKLISPSNAQWRLEHADSPIGPFQSMSQSLAIQIGRNLLRFRLPEETKPYIRLVPLDSGTKKGPAGPFPENT